MKTLTYVSLCLMGLAVSTSAQFNSGSTGTVALNITADTTLDLPPAGILHYTTITVESNATLRFNRNSNNTPVHLLATGDVAIFGTIDVSGGNATTAAPFLPGKGGPGGFDGGWPGEGGVPAGDGYGPGGGKAGIGIPDANQGSTTAAGSGSYAFQTYNNYDGNTGLGYASNRKGATYGSALLVPLLGGSGGGGIGASANVTFGRGGGGGGGAVLIASTTRIVVTGTIRAEGGDGQTFFSGIYLNHLNPGSGGGIRLVAPLVEGTGLLSTHGPYRGDSSTNNFVNNYGRIRIDSLDRRNLSLLGVGGDRSIGNYMVVFPTPTPRLGLINVAGTVIAEGSVPITIQLPNGSSTNQTVVVQARNFNSASLPIQIAIAPQNGPTVIYTTNINNSGANTSATNTVNVIIPVSTPVTVSAWTRVP